MSAIISEVSNRGFPPLAFIQKLVMWANDALDEIFAPNDNPRDIYATIAPVLGNEKKPRWNGLTHRKAAMLEVMRVHAGFESSWKWEEGVDTTNHNSMAHAEGQEAGIFQVSFDSTFLGGGAMKPFAELHKIETPRKFIDEMKKDHWLAMEYYARLLRVSVQWAGPIKRHEIDEWLKRAAVTEFMALLD